MTALVQAGQVFLPMAEDKAGVKSGRMFLQ
jgi:hypothetical protein